MGLRPSAFVLEAERLAGEQSRSDSRGQAHAD
jgi:hypothetical protein